MYARGLSTRDIEALFADAAGKSLLSRTVICCAGGGSLTHQSAILTLNLEVRRLGGE